MAANVKLLILKHVKVLDGVHEVGPWPNGIEFALDHREVMPPALFAPNCSSVLVAEGLTMGGTVDYGALASALGGVLTLAIMIWIANAGRG